MNMIWRLQHHQWTDFTYPDGKTIKVLVVPMREVIITPHEPLPVIIAKALQEPTHAPTAYVGSGKNMYICNELVDVLARIGEATASRLAGITCINPRRIRGSLRWNWQTFEVSGKDGTQQVWRLRRAA